MQSSAPIPKGTLLKTQLVDGRSNYVLRTWLKNEYSVTLIISTPGNILKLGPHSQSYSSFILGRIVHVKSDIFKDC